MEDSPKERITRREFLKRTAKRAAVIAALTLLPEGLVGCVSKTFQPFKPKPELEKEKEEKWPSYHGVKLAWGEPVGEETKEKIIKELDKNKVDSPILGVVSILHPMGIIGVTFDGRDARMVEEEHWINPKDDPNSPIVKIAELSLLEPWQVTIRYVDIVKAEPIPGTFEIAYGKEIPPDAPKASTKYEIDNMGIVVEVFRGKEREIFTQEAYSNPLLGPLAYGLEIRFDIMWEYGLWKSSPPIIIPDEILDESLEKMQKKVSDLTKMVVYPVWIDAEGSLTPRLEGPPGEGLTA